MIKLRNLSKLALILLVILACSGFLLITVSADKADSSSEAPKRIIIPPPEQPKLDVNISVNKSSYEVGSSLEVTYRVSEEAYIYILLYDTQGIMRIIFPNQYTQSNLREPGTFRLPDDTYQIQVSGPPGTQFVQAVASTKEIDIFNFVGNPSDPYSEVAYPVVAKLQQLINEIKKRGLSVQFYWKPGMEEPSLKLVPVWDSAIASYKVTQQQVNIKPTPKFAFNPTRLNRGENVNFDASGSYDSDGYITQYLWDFEGDGRTDALGIQVSNRYWSTGQFNVKLTVRDNQGETSSITKTLQVGRVNQNPIANFNYLPSNPLVGEKVTFNVSSSRGPDVEIISRQWDFGDGTSSEEQNPIHQYEDDGTYTVKLTVTDDQGATDSITKEIEVSNVSPKADFTFSPSKPVINASVTFDASKSSDPDGKIKEYQWDFGDGTTEKGEKVSHTYTSEGTYQVKLTVIDDDGDTDSIQKELEVTTPSPEIKARYGIVIGISDYKYADDKTCPGFCDLKYSAQDAKAFYELLVDEKIGAFPKDNVTLLIDDKATVSAIKSAFSRLIAKVGKDDLVVIYYSGHGGQGPDLNNDEGDGTDEYYIAYNTQPKDADKLFASGIRDDEFGDWLNSLRSKQVTILLDSCYSGGATKTIKGTSPPGYKAGPNNSVFNDFSFEDRFLLSASQENQVSFESEELGHGVFTHYLLEGLKGKADLDQDGKVTAQEVYGYVKPKVNEYVTNKWPGYSQIPFSKGTVTAAVVSKQKVRKGKTTAIEGEKKQAQVGDHVSINLGSKDGIEVGDVFKVYHELSSKGIIITEVRGKIKVIDVIEDHRSICEVIEAKFPIEVGDRVRKVKG